MSTGDDLAVAVLSARCALLPAPRLWRRPCFFASGFYQDSAAGKHQYTASLRHRKAKPHLEPPHGPVASLLATLQGPGFAVGM